MRVVAVTAWIVALATFTTLAASAIGQNWVELPSSAQPSVGYRAMAYDPVRERVVCVVDEAVFAGPGNQVGKLVVWEWDGDTWLRITTPTTVATSNSAIALAWDPPNRRMLCVGVLAGTWAYDGTDWQLVQGQGGNWPSPSLCFDPVRSVMVGITGSQLNELVGNQWVFRSNLPTFWLSTGLAFDPQSNRLLLFGGLGVFGPIPGTWTWNGTSFQQLATTMSPGGRFGHAFVVDPTTGLLLACGGRSATTFAALADVLAWTGSDWLAEQPLPQPTAAPLAVAFAGAARVLGPGALWTRQVGGSFLATPLPAASPQGPCAFDPLRQRTVAIADGATHEFDGYAWTRTNVPSPSGAAFLGMTWHAGLGSVAAIDANRDLFTFDGVQWAPLPATNKPSAAAAAFTYDEQRQCLAMAIGGAVHTMANGTWTVEPTLPLSPSSAIGLAYDHATQRLVASGGQSVVARTATGWTALPSFPGNPVPRTDLASDGTTLWAQEQVATAGGQRTFRLVGNAWSPVDNLNGVSAGAPIYDGARGTLVVHQQGRSLARSPGIATGTRFGIGCSLAPELPRLHAPVRPGIGQRMVLDLDRAPAATAAALFFDFTAANTPLPGGCTLLLANPTSLGLRVTNALGGASWTWTVPPNPSLRGASVFHQALVLAAPGALAGLGDLSNGVNLLVGD